MTTIVMMYLLLQTGILERLYSVDPMTIEPEGELVQAENFTVTKKELIYTPRSRVWLPIFNGKYIIDFPIYWGSSTVYTFTLDTGRVIEVSKDLYDLFKVDDILGVNRYENGGLVLFKIYEDMWGYYHH